MSKYLVVAAVVALAACGGKQDDAPAVDTTAVTTTTTVTTTVTDTTIKVDTTKVAGDTAKTP
jgi:ABC-type glycerol-3-phosphate transport system substrate-binding protein